MSTTEEKSQSDPEETTGKPTGPMKARKLVKRRKKPQPMVKPVYVSSEQTISDAPGQDNPTRPMWSSVETVDGITIWYQPRKAPDTQGEPTPLDGLQTPPECQAIANREKVIAEAAKQDIRLHYTMDEQMTRFARTCTTLLDETGAPEPQPQEPDSLITLRHALNFFIAAGKRREEADKVDGATRKHARDVDEEMHQGVQRLQQVYTEIVKDQLEQHVNRQTDK
jgi:hypothetical protein